MEKRVRATTVVPKLPCLASLEPRNLGDGEYSPPPLSRGSRFSASLPTPFGSPVNRDAFSVSEHFLATPPKSDTYVYGHHTKPKLENAGKKRISGRKTAISNTSAASLFSISPLPEVSGELEALYTSSPSISPPLSPSSSPLSGPSSGSLLPRSLLLSSSPTPPSSPGSPASPAPPASPVTPVDLSPIPAPITSTRTLSLPDEIRSRSPPPNDNPLATPKKRSTLPPEFTEGRGYPAEGERKTPREEEKPSSFYPQRSKEISCSPPHNGQRRKLGNNRAFNLKVASKGESDEHLVGRSKSQHVAPFKPVTSARSPNNSGGSPPILALSAREEKMRKRRSFMMNMPNVPILIGDKKDKKDKKDPSLTPPLENSPIPSSSPNPSPREPQPPLEEGIYICRRAYDCPKDKHFFVQKNESVHVLGWAPMSKTWVVVEKSQGEEEENEEKGKEEMKRTIGFCPLICLVPKMEKKEGEQEGEGEEWSKYQEELEKVINEADLPLPLERDFEIVKPLLANTPFLKHVGLSTTVKTLKVSPWTTVKEMEQALTQSVIRGLKGDVYNLISEECSTCRMCRGPAKGDEEEALPLSFDENPFKIRYLDSLRERKEPSSRMRFYFRKLSPNFASDNTEAKRKRIVGEIHSTEVFYVSALLEMMEGFRKPLLVSAKRPHSTLKEDDMVKLFGNARTILKLHVDIFIALNQLFYNWTPTTALGGLFLHFAPIMIIYTEYSTNYPIACDLWQKYQSNTDFVSEHTALKKKISLDNLLIMPIQRLPRYNLLLRDLLKNTPESHPDHPLLGQAIELIQRLCDRINECTDKAVHTQKAIDLVVKDGLMSHYIAAFRQLYISFEASTAKIELGNKHGKEKTEKYLFYCFNDMLVVGTGSDAKRKQMTEIPLNLVWVKKEDDVTFVITIPFYQFTIKCESDVEFLEWFESLKEPITNELKKQLVEKKNLPRNVSALTDKRNWHCKIQGGVYFGEWSHGLPNGRGRITAPTFVYEGDWVFGKMTGIGEALFLNGDRYRGEWIEGQMDGEGVYKTKTGEIYQGRMSKNKWEGEGSVEWANGDKYKGGWVGGVMCGKGKLEYGNGRGEGYEEGAVYEGLFEEGLFHGEGKLMFWERREGGERVVVGRYEGEFRYGVKNGKGKCVGRGGEEYDGEWVGDLPNGKGSWMDKKGNQYVGGWENGKRNGTGVMHYGGGEGEGSKKGWGGIMGDGWENTKGDAGWVVYDGGWVGGVRHGKTCKESYSNGIMYVGGVRWGKRSGLGVVSMEGGWGGKKGILMMEGAWENGMKEGKFVFRLGGGGAVSMEGEEGEGEEVGVVVFREGVVVSHSFSSSFLSSVVSKSFLGCSGPPLSSPLCMGSALPSSVTTSTPLQHPVTSSTSSISLQTPRSPVYSITTSTPTLPPPPSTSPLPAQKIPSSSNRSPNRSPPRSPSRSPRRSPLRSPHRSPPKNPKTSPSSLLSASAPLFLSPPLPPPHPSSLPSLLPSSIPSFSPQFLLKVEEKSPISFMLGVGGDSCLRPFENTNFMVPPFF